MILKLIINKNVILIIIKLVYNFEY
jgi:hypothetical protein